MSIVLAARGLRKSYGPVAALAGVDLEVNAGEVFGFLGPNGAGKTTFTKCITGFVRPDAGSVRIMGIDAVANPVDAAPHIGLVPDQYDFYPTLTGRQHLEFYGRLLGMPTDVRRRRIAEVLREVRMEERADARVKGYSHGMKQRICIAQAILHKPGLVILDEPTNGLDVAGAYELRQMIRGLAAAGHTVFLNSHLMSEVQETCDRVAILDRGLLRTVATVRELRSRGGSSIRIRVLNPSPRLAKAVAAAMPAARFEGTEVVLAGDDDQAAEAVAALVKAGARIAGVKREEQSLEAAFLSIIGGPGSSRGGMA